MEYYGTLYFGKRKGLEIFESSGVVTELLANCNKENLLYEYLQLDLEKGFVVRRPTDKIQGFSVFTFQGICYLFFITYHYAIDEGGRLGYYACSLVLKNKMLPIPSILEYQKRINESYALSVDIKGGSYRIAHKAQLLPTYVFPTEEAPIRSEKRDSSIIKQGVLVFDTEDSVEEALALAIGANLRGIKPVDRLFWANASELLANLNAKDVLRLKISDFASIKVNTPKRNEIKVIQEQAKVDPPHDSLYPKLKQRIRQLENQLRIYQEERDFYYKENQDLKLRVAKIAREDEIIPAKGMVRYIQLFKQEVKRRFSQLFSTVFKVLAFWIGLISIMVILLVNFPHIFQINQDIRETPEENVGNEWKKERIDYLKGKLKGLHTFVEKGINGTEAPQYFVDRLNLKLQEVKILERLYPEYFTKNMRSELALVDSFAHRITICPSETNRGAEVIQGYLRNIEIQQQPSAYEFPKKTPETSHYHEFSPDN